MRRPFRVFSLLVLVLMLALGSTAYAQSTFDSQSVDAYLTSMQQLYEITGMGVAIVREGEVIFAKGYGVRDMESNAPVTPQTHFSIGSITKSMTVLAAMRLVEAGKLSLDAPIVEYLPEFTLRDAAHANAVTLRHLFSHTSGIPLAELAWYNGEVTDAEGMLAYLATQPIRSALGTRYEYNNWGYALAGVVLERVTGKPYAEYLREAVLAPLAMPTATLSYAAMQQTDDFAAPHRFDVRKGAQRIPFFAYLDQVIAPAGAVTANVLEMANYAIFQMGDGTFQNTPIISAKSLTEMHTPIKNGYGLGWVTTELEGFQTVWHNGAIDGFAAMLAMAPEQQTAVIILSNGDQGDNPNVVEMLAAGVLYLTINPQRADSLETLTAGFKAFDPKARAERFAALRSFTPDPSHYAAYAGKYASLFAQIEINVRDGGLYADIVQQGVSMSFELVEFAPRAFIANMTGLMNEVFAFRLNENGSVALLQNETVIAVKPAQ
ncbi:MAG: hypothetical protein DYG88_12085 [Chloroflexi bacterium CFX4]|nr:hypothetical protein [Chloroflexi bacterium CFX4]MDL1923114.1 serine hydrolase [Chloroflexi bacterium CFX3]